MAIAIVLSVHVGRVAPLGPQQVPSGFIKSKVDGPVRVEPMGIVGDQQADLSLHGGLEKAVYGYSVDHYPAWARDFPAHSAAFVAGAVGENLAIAGLAERDLCVGDVHRIGTVLLQTCQPRQPCYKLALRFDDNGLPRAMVRSGRAGWYYRVLEPGTLGGGDPVELEHRPNPSFRFDRLVEIANFRNASPSELRAMATMDGLASDFREAAAAALGRA